MKRPAIVAVVMVLTTPLALSFTTVPRVGSSRSTRPPVAIPRSPSSVLHMKTLRKESVRKASKILRHVKREKRRLKHWEGKTIGLLERREARRQSESCEDVEPISTRSRVSIDITDAGSLRITIPALGFTRSSHSEIGAAGCFLLIAARVTPAITSGLGGVIFGTLSSLPFWLGGGALAKRSLVDPMTSVELSIGMHAWDLNKKAVRKGGMSTGGPTRDLVGANVNSNISLNGRPLTCIELVSGKESYSFGTGLSVGEKQQVVTEINRWLEVNRDNISESVHDGLLPAEDHFID